MEPAWLVLGQSYGDGWTASCDGRDLGEPRPVDGYAMAWRVPAGCRVADMSFGPDGAVRAGYLLSGPVLLALLLLLVVRRRPAPELAGPPAEVPEASASRLPLARAALLALAAGALLGFVFAARSAPLIAAATFVVLWRGIGVRELVAAAGVLLLVAVPVLTPRDRRRGPRRLQPGVRAGAHRGPLGRGGRGGAAHAGAGSGARCSATPAITSVTPAASAGDGTWPSTTTPMTAAVAGSSETSSA